MASDMDFKTDLVVAYRTLAAEGVIDAYGHVSMRSPNDPNRYFLARSLAPELVREEDLLEYDLDSNAIDAEGAVSVFERFIHGEIYKARPEINAVVHSHSATVVPFSVCDIELKPIFHMAAFVGLGVPNFEIRDSKQGSDLLIRDTYLGAALARTLGNCPATLMRGHGAAIVGENLPRAVGRAIYLEMSASMQMQLMSVGGRDMPITTIDDGEVAAAVPRQDYGRAWGLWKDRVLATLKLELNEKEKS
ncbi:class II aldolase/adducin family protein [soil metagenome]